MEPEFSLPHSQVSATCPYTESEITTTSFQILSNSSSMNHVAISHTIILSYYKRRQINQYK